MYKHFPLKASFLIATFIFESGSVISGFANTSNALVAGRAVAGVGAAGISAGAYLIISVSAPPRRRPALTGILSATYGITGIAGPILGGTLTDHASWRWCFLINLPIGAVSSLVIFIYFHAPPSAAPDEIPLRDKLRSLDPLGSALTVGAIVLYLHAVQYGGVSHAWNSSVVVGLLAGFVAMAAAWTALQCFHGERSVLPPHLARNRTIAVMSVAGFFVSGGLYTTIYSLPVYFQSVDGASSVGSGVYNLPFIISATAFGIGSGAFVSATGYYQHLLLGGAVLAAIGSGLLHLLDVDTSTGEWIGYQVVAGAGWGCAFQIPLIAIQGSIPPADMALGTAIMLCTCTRLAARAMRREPRAEYCAADTHSRLVFRTLGATLIVSGGQSAFMNETISVVLNRAPGIDKAALLATGATQIRQAFSAELLPAVVEGYTAGLKAIFAMCVACAGLLLIASMGVRWERLNSSKAAAAGEGAA